MPIQLPQPSAQHQECIIIVWFIVIVHIRRCCSVIMQQQQRCSQMVSSLCVTLSSSSWLRRSLMDALAESASAENVLESKEEFVERLLDHLKLRPMSKTVLQNAVFHLMRDTCSMPSMASETLITETQRSWRRRLVKSLKSLASELNVAVAKPRDPDDHEEWRLKWHELSTLNVVTDAKALLLVKPVFAPKDLLDVIVTHLTDSNLGKENGLVSNSELVLGLIRLPLVHTTLSSLRGRFGCLHMHVSLHSKASESVCCKEREERFNLGLKVIQRGLAPLAQEYLKLGSPHSLRAGFWSLVLVAPFTNSKMKKEEEEEEEEELAVLRASVLSSDLLMDRIIIKDVKVAAANDDNYFVFEDVILNLMLLFSRDTTLPQRVHETLREVLVTATLRSSSTTADEEDDKSTRKINESLDVFYPPNGLVPFHGFSLYAAPFCYVYKELNCMYDAFKAFYCRYLCHLHHISLHNNGIVKVSHLFETLVQENESALWLHLRSHNIQPLRTAFRWLMRAFAGHLPPEPLLYLWDLVLAHDSLDIVAILAAAIFSFRKANLMQVSTQQGVEGVMADLNSIPVIPILTLALQPEERRKQAAGSKA